MHVVCVTFYVTASDSYYFSTVVIIGTFVWVPRLCRRLCRVRVLPRAWATQETAPVPTPTDRVRRISFSCPRVLVTSRPARIRAAALAAGSVSAGQASTTRSVDGPCGDAPTPPSGCAQAGRLRRLQSSQPRLSRRH